MITTTITILFLSTEILFAIYYHFHLLPKIKYISRKLAKTSPHIYRNYEKDRYKLYLRILERIEETCLYINKPFYSGLERFLHGWFVECEEQEEKKDEISDNKVLNENSKEYEYEVAAVYKEDIEELMAWAFFSKYVDDLEPWERIEMHKMHQYAEDKNVLIKQGKKGNLRANSYSFQEMRPWYRPLFIYIFMSVIYWIGCIFLYNIGFRKYVTSTGLTYWYHPGYPTKNALYPDKDQQKCLPILFFHGIAPGGLSLYTPMIYFGFMKLFKMNFNRHQPPIFLFENPNISYQLQFDALDEKQTVQGVMEALECNLPPRYDKVSVIGHSFGSAQITWLLHGMPQYIGQLILLDPVSILLSEPDVLSNFFHNIKNVNNHYTEQDRPQFHQTTKLQQTKIQYIASTEISIEYYLKTKFAWFNSELWLEDIPKDVNVLIFLSGQDCIVPTNKVRRYVDLKGLENVELFCWEECGHGDCVVGSRYWKEIFGRMVRQQTT